MRRLGVLGPLVWDTIWTEEDLRRGTPFTSWGGMAYSLASAAAARPDGWEVVPLLKVGDDLEAEARKFLASLPGFSVGPSVFAVPVPNNRVELRYLDNARRGERQTGGVPGWEWSELEPHLAGLDALYVNFISGFELSLETAKRLRAEFSGPLYTDLHSLFLGCPGAGTRARRRLPDWERWVACFDGVQVNEEEVATLADLPESWADGAARLLRQGARVAAVTLGPDGAGVASAAGLPEDPAEWRTGSARAGGDEPIVRIYPTDPDGAGDPTGCGDVWGASFFSRLLAGDGIDAAATFAHRLAARKLGHRGASGLYEHFAHSSGG
ncbi:MAG TPA: carbohydrate kinase family protein [Longimicrobiaceae bacterium]|jgi:sugar/nucleoside kinase (ribokinase family)|nr:carbohydrate kinase family protein [Longimicrobiaceae bacterium]